MAVLRAAKTLRLALDISGSSTGYALRSHDGKLHSGAVAGKSKDYRRLLEMAFDLGTILWSECQDLPRYYIDVVVEQPFFRPGMSFDLPIKMAHGVILREIAGLAGPEGYSWNDVGVSTWRNWLFRRTGVSPKDVKDKKGWVVNQVNKLYDLNLTIEQHDQADALAILYWLEHNNEE